MSQTVTYKTEYKDMNAIKKVLDELVGKGVFGKNAKILVRDKNGLDTGVYYYNAPEKKENIIFRVKDGGGEYFKEGFFDKGFAIAQDDDGNIELVFDYNSGRGADTQKVTDAVRKHVDDMLKAGTALIETQKNMKDTLKGMKVNKKSETEWEIEGEVTPEQLKALMGR